MEKYKVTGMSCAACSARVEKAVKAVGGVTSCEVNLLTGDMRVEGGVREDVVSAVRAAGYGIAEASEGGKSGKSREKSACCRKGNQARKVPKG